MCGSRSILIHLATAWETTGNHEDEESLGLNDIKEVSDEAAVVEPVAVKAGQ
jgi:hypothetical protein